MALFSPREPERRARRRPDTRQPERQPVASPRQQATFSYHAARSYSDGNIGRTAPAEQSAARPAGAVRRLAGMHRRAVIGGVVAVLVLLFNLQVSTTPKVVPLTTNSDAPFLRDQSVYQAAAAALFRKSATNRNKLTINGSAIAAQLKQQFPELQDVSVALPLLGAQPTVYVQPSSPAAILKAVNGSFVLDQNGRALIKLDPSADSSRFQVPTITDQSSLPVTVGQAALARSTASFIHDAVRQLQAQHMTVSRTVLPAASGELDLYPDGKAFFVKFNLRDQASAAAQLQAGTYLAVQKYLDGHTIQPAQYIDVRVPGRAYYK